MHQTWQLSCFPNHFSLASHTYCAMLCDKKQPAGTCNAYVLNGNWSCSWGKLKTDFIQQTNKIEECFSKRKWLYRPTAKAMAKEMNIGCVAHEVHYVKEITMHYGCGIHCKYGVHHGYGVQPWVWGPP